MQAEIEARKMDRGWVEFVLNAQIFFNMFSLVSLCASTYTPTGVEGKSYVHGTFNS